MDGTSIESRSVAGVGTSETRTSDHRRRGEVKHPLGENDLAAIVALREAVAPFKGTMTGPAARAPFDELMEHTPAAAGVTYVDGYVGDVAGVWCRPANARPDAVILYLHGGSYVLGSAHAYRHFVGQIAARSGAAAFVVDYRLAPEHPFPAAVDDAMAAYRGLSALGARSIAVVGDSAGGGLALVTVSVAQSEAEAGQGVAPVGGVAMSPWTDLALTGASLEGRAAADPLVTRAMLEVTAASYLAGHDARDPLASPLYGALAGLPSMQLHVGEDEVLLDDARRYTERAHQAAVDATLHVWEGMAHVFPASVGTMSASGAALDAIGAFLTARLRTRSVAMRIHRYGGPDVVVRDTVPMPAVTSGQVLVNVRAAGVNALDWKVREGWLKEAMPLPLPIALGVELAGVVVEIGAGVARLKVGDRVMGPKLDFGAYADFVATDEASLSLTPTGLTDIQAASIPVGGLAAWQALEAAGDLRRGQTILIHGAAGAVGGFAVQFAKAKGLSVMATASASSGDYLLKLGADVVIDYRAERFEDRAKDVDVVLDLVGGDIVARSWQVLVKDGVLVSTASMDLAARTPTGRRSVVVMMQPDAARLATIAGAVARGALSSRIAEVTDLAGLALALERNKTGHAPGKMVLDLTR